MSVFDHPEFDQHEAIHFFDEPASGLKAIIAVHSTALGPGAGGCRRWSYASDRDAITDVLRLSRGMTYKNAVAGLPFGGGKAVILAADAAPKSAALFRAFGRAVHSLGGAYITAEDVGIGVDDMRAVREETPYVSGLPQASGTAGGDPSPWTARGVFLGIAAAARERLDREKLDGLRVAVQGVGSVGLHLCRLLVEAGAQVIVADVNRENLRRATGLDGVQALPPRDILYADVDILAPCALGNILNSELIPRLKATIVAGAANNQLATERDGERLAGRNILYAPDYVINAGGIISVAREYLGQSSGEEVRREVERIPERLTEIFREAAATGRPTNRIADDLARRIVAGARTAS
ncbi:MAG TPA: Glu/Leu/Phe/Val dehydrogenase [Woeseiaceae bacterium]|nr:Glu/Leu/Phe/Val dehydrogenase [Woeseiaceae bacterium]